MDANATVRPTRARPAGLIRILLTAALWLAGGGAHAVDLAIWVSQQGSLQKTFLDTFRDELAKSDGQRIQTVVDLSRTAQPEATGRIVLAVGIDASRAAVAAGAEAVLSVLVSQRDARVLVAGSQRTPVTAIVLDQPDSRRLALLRALLPEVRSVAVLLGTESTSLHSELSAAIRASGLTPRIAEISAMDEIVPALDRLLVEGSALLTVPDPQIYNRDTVMSIFLTSYRHRRPVIGFTAAYVRAGAVAAVFSSPEDIARQAAALLAKVRDPRQMASAILPPTRYQVAINDRVLRALGLAPLTEAELAERVRAGESAP